MTTLLLGVLVFLLAAAIEWADVAYNRAAMELNPARAARYGSAMYVLGAIGWVAVVKVSIWLLVPEGAGVACGIYVAVWHAARRARCMRSSHC